MTGLTLAVDVAVTSLTILPVGLLLAAILGILSVGLLLATIVALLVLRHTIACAVGLPWLESSSAR